MADIRRSDRSETTTRLSWNERFRIGWQGTREIVGKVWPYVIVGIGIGAAIHGFVPENALADILGKGAWWSVPAGVVLGIPLYANAAGIIPVVAALMEKGAAVGTTLAFMMSVVALSLPEMIISAPGAQTAPDRTLRRGGRPWYHLDRLSVQLCYLAADRFPHRHGENRR